jgi:hypothetical protein
MKIGQEFNLFGQEFNLFGAYEGDTDGLKSLLLKMGFNQDELEQVESGTLSIDDAFNSRSTAFESSVKARIESDIERTKKAEIFAAAYNKLEKQIAKTFGLDISAYETMSKEGKAEKMLQDAAELHESKVQDIKSKFTGIDETKIKEIEAKYQIQLDASNNELKAAREAKEAALIDAQNRVNGIKKSVALSERKSQFFSNLKNPALTPKQIETILNGELSKYDIDVEDGENSRVWVLDSEGKRMVNPKSPTENLTIDDLLENIKTEYEFERKSNGNENNGIELPANGQGLENTSSNYQKQLEIAKQKALRK